MDISKLLQPQSVLCDVEARNRKHVLELASELLADAPAESPQARLDAADVLGALAARERLGCTAIGHSVAIPHGRLAGIADSRGAFLRLAAPVDFEAADGEPVDLIFALLLPAGEIGEQHGRKLGELAQMFFDPGLQQRLRSARDAHEIYALLTGHVARRTATG